MLTHNNNLPDHISLGQSENVKHQKFLIGGGKTW